MELAKLLRSVTHVRAGLAFLPQLPTPRYLIALLLFFLPSHGRDITPPPLTYSSQSLIPTPASPRHVLLPRRSTRSRLFT